MMSGAMHPASWTKSGIGNPVPDAPGGDWNFARISALRHKRILAEATRIFVEAGYESARIGDISIAAGLGQGMLYRYYASKSELCSAVVRDAFEDFGASLQGLLDPAAPLEPTLIAYADRYTDLLGGETHGRVPLYKVLRLLISRSLEDPQLVASCMDMLKRDIVTPLKAYFTAQIAANRLGGASAPALAYSFAQLLFPTDVAMLGGDHLAAFAGATGGSADQVKFFLRGALAPG
jgi:AcrR family transcriptional regulator